MNSELKSVQESEEGTRFLKGRFINESTSNPPSGTLPELYWNETARNIFKETNIQKKKNDVQLLHDRIIHVPSSVLTELDIDGMCLLHRVLLIIQDLEPNKNGEGVNDLNETKKSVFCFDCCDGRSSKNQNKTYKVNVSNENKQTEVCKKHEDDLEEMYDQLLDIIKALLIKSDLDYHGYSYPDKNGVKEKNVVLTLLKNCDGKKNNVTFFVRQILFGEEDKFIFFLEESKVRSKTYLKIFRNFRDLLQVTFAVGSLKTLKVLLKHGEELSYNFNTMESPLLLIATWSRIYVRPENLDKYYECFDYVLSLKDFEVNVIEHNDGNTVLHVAKDPVLIEKLLTLKPWLNIENHNKELPIHNPCFTYEKFIKYLDSNTSSSIPQRLLSDEHFLSSLKVEKFSEANFIFLDLASISKDSSSVIADKRRQLNLLEFIAAVRDDEKCSNAILHPCLATVIEIYWNFNKYWILWKKLPMIIMSILMLLMFFFDTSRVYCIIVFILCIVVFVLKLLVALPTMRSRTPFKKLLLLEFVFLGLSILWWISDWNTFLSMAYLCAAAAITIYLSVAVESVAHTLLMFIRVIRSTAFYSSRMLFILIGFSLSLKKIIDNYDQFKLKDVPADASKANQNKLSSLFFSINKSIFMSVGELGVDDLVFNNKMACLLILVFILFISISFMNLLNGLAFSDVQEAKNEAELHYRRFQIRFMLIVREDTSRNSNSSLCHIPEKFLNIVNLIIRKKIYKLLTKVTSMQRNTSFRDEVFPNYKYLGVDKDTHKVVLYMYEELYMHAGHINNELVTQLVQSLKNDASSSGDSITMTEKCQDEWNVSIITSKKGLAQQTSKESGLSTKLNMKDLTRIIDFISDNRATAKDEAGQEMIANIKIKRISLSDDRILIECHDEYTQDWIKSLGSGSVEDSKYRIMTEPEEIVSCSIKVLTKSKGYTVEEFKAQLVKGNPGIKIKTILLHSIKTEVYGQAVIYFSIDKSGYESLRALNFEVFFDCMMTLISNEPIEEKKGVKRPKLSRLDF